ncbi:hypothetical protein CEXT_649471 [Caerostris extrusa]|uniref:Uncharacterized protein n=1 Tax=Caerostris extrusa TaxID=172846 RepID=A0AAV4VU00_CAEEX|nr:hypothetical protein CEXT_649471 [Caerostris extrusa]
MMGTGRIIKPLTIALGAEHRYAHTTILFSEQTQLGQEGTEQEYGAKGSNRGLILSQYFAKIITISEIFGSSEDTQQEY